MALIKQTLPPRNYQYQSRAILEAKVDQALNQKPGIVALIGSTGKGKTEIAKAYAYRLIDATEDTGYEFIGWIDCSSFQSYSDSWVAIESVLYSPRRGDVHKVLKALSKKCLLIFDNAQAEIRPGEKLVNILPSSPNINIIITSSSPYWDVRTVWVPEFTRKESCELVLRIFDEQGSAREVKNTRMAVDLSEAAVDFPAAVAEAAVIASQRHLNTYAYTKQLDQQEFERVPTITLPAYQEQIRRHLVPEITNSAPIMQLLKFITQLGITRVSSLLLEQWRIHQGISEADLSKGMDLLLRHGFVESQSKIDRVLSMPLPMQLVLRSMLDFNVNDNYEASIAGALTALANNVQNCSIIDHIFNVSKEEIYLLEVHISTLLRRLNIFSASVAMTPEIQNNLSPILSLLNFLGAFYLSNELLDKTKECTGIILNLLTQAGHLNNVVIHLFGPKYDLAFPQAPPVAHPVIAVFDHAYCVAHPETMPILTLYTDALYNEISANLRAYNLSTELSDDQVNSINALIKRCRFILHIQQAMLVVLNAAPVRDTSAITKLERKIFFTQKRLVLAQRICHREIDPQSFDDTEANALQAMLPTDRKLDGSKKYIASFVSEHKEAYLRAEIYRLPLIEDALKTRVRLGVQFTIKKGWGFERPAWDREVLDLVTKWYGFLNTNRRSSINKAQLDNFKTTLDGQRAAGQTENLTLADKQALLAQYTTLQTELAVQKNDSITRKSLLTQAQLMSPYEDALKLVKEACELCEDAADPENCLKLIRFLIQQADLHVKRYQAFKQMKKKEQAIVELNQAIECYEKAQRIYKNQFYHQASFDAYDIYYGLIFCYFALQDYAGKTYDLYTILYYLQLAQENCSQFHSVSSADATLYLYDSYLRLVSEHNLKEFKSFYDIRFFLPPSFFQEHLDKLNECIEQEPNNVWLYLQRGDIFLAVGEWQAAIANYEQFLYVYPYSVLALSHRAVAYVQLGRYIEAIVDFEYVLSLPGQAENPLVKNYLASARLTYDKMIRGLEDTIPGQSELGLFIRKFTEIFATELERYLKIADGTDKRIPGYAIAARVIKSVATLIPSTAKAAGLTFDLPPVDKVIGDIADLGAEVAAAKREFSSQKIARTAKTLEGELDQSELFKSFSQELALT